MFVFNNELANRDLIEKASEQFNKIKKYVPYNDWEANFINTEGLIEFLNAKISKEKDSYEETISKLEKAKAKLEEARIGAEKAKYFDYEIRKIKYLIDDIIKYSALFNVKMSTNEM